MLPMSICHVCCESPQWTGKERIVTPEPVKYKKKKTKEDWQ